MPSQPLSYFGVEAEVELHVRIVQDSPWAFIGPKLDAMFPQTVVVTHTTIKEQTKCGQVMHGVLLEARVTLKDAAPELLVVRNLDRAAAPRGLALPVSVYGMSATDRSYLSQSD